MTTPAGPPPGQPHGGSADDQTIAQFSAALDAYPGAFAGNRLQLLFLEHATPIPSAGDYLRRLDSPVLMREGREYLIQTDQAWPFPRTRVLARPEPWALSARLFDRFDDAPGLLPCQRDVGSILEMRIRRDRPETVVLAVSDGLSYYDLPESVHSEPCLVAGISTTAFGYRDVVGAPSVARRLFALGYRHQRGYSYFPPNVGTLSAEIFATFSPTQVTRVTTFDEVLRAVQQGLPLKSYIQVALSGLDQICHSHRDRPPRAYYLNELLHRFEQLVDCLSAAGRRVLGCLTADHGILWRDELEGRAEVVTDLFSEDVRSPRYVRGHVLRVYGKPCICLDHPFTPLGLPYLTRPLRANEWGVHGGISAWESVVPLRIVTSY